MQLRKKKLGLASGGINIIILDDEDAFKINAKPGSRVRIFKKNSDGTLIEPGIIAIVDLATGTGIVEQGEVGVYDEVEEKLTLSEDDKTIEIFLSSKPKSYASIRKKIQGKELTTQEILGIVNDCVEERLLGIELASFITGVEIHGLSENEIVDFTYAFTHSGDILDLGPNVYDKHSTGGVPGNKITLIIVPIIASAGLLIPKTSTRAITSPSGTADSMEVLASVSFTKEEILRILESEKAGIFWAGAMKSAPAADIFIKIEKSLNIDPLPIMIASILSKKLSMGVKILTMDIPVGPGTKFPTVEIGRKFARQFKEIAQRVGIECTCLLTSASQPIGHAVGPALEAREALRLLIDPSVGPSSLLNKSTDLAGALLEMAGKAPEGRGKEYATAILKSGKAYDEMKQLIRTQGGFPDILPEDITVGPYVAEMRAETQGIISEVNNKHINSIAKIAGCPASKSAGIEIEYKIGHKVQQGDAILKIYAPTQSQLDKAIEFYNSHPVVSFASMTIEKI